MSEYINDAENGTNNNLLVILIFISDLKIHRMFRNFRRSQKAPARTDEQDIYTLNGFAFEEGYYYYFRINGTGGSITKSDVQISSENYHPITKIGNEPGLEYGFEYTLHDKTEQYRIFTYSDATVPYCLDMLIPEIEGTTDEIKQKNKVIDKMNTTLVYAFLSKLISYTTDKGIDHPHVIYFLYNDWSSAMTRKYMNDSEFNQLTTLYTNAIFNGISDTCVLGIYTECISEVINKIKTINESKLASFLTVFRFECTDDEQMTLRFIPFGVYKGDYVTFSVKTDSNTKITIDEDNRDQDLCLLRIYSDSNLNAEIMYNNVNFYYAPLISASIENKDTYDAITSFILENLGLYSIRSSVYTVYNLLHIMYYIEYEHIIVLANNLTIMVDHLIKAFNELNSMYGYRMIRNLEWINVQTDIIFQLESIFYQLANKAYKLNADGSYSWFGPLEEVWEPLYNLINQVTLNEEDYSTNIETMQENPSTWYTKSQKVSMVTDLLKRRIGNDGNLIQYNQDDYYYYVTDSGTNYKLERSWKYNSNEYTLPLVHLFLSRTYTLTDYLYFLKRYYETHTNESTETIRTLILDNKLILEDMQYDTDTADFNYNELLTLLNGYSTPRYLNYDDITRVYRAFMQTSGVIMELIQSTFTYVYHDYNVQFKGYQENSSETGYSVGYGYITGTNQEGQPIFRQLTDQYGTLSNVTDDTITLDSEVYNRAIWFVPNIGDDPQTTVPSTVELLRFQLNDFNEVEKMKESDPAFRFKYEQEFSDWYTRWQNRLNALYNNLKEQAERCTKFLWYSSSSSNEGVYSEIQFTEEEVIKWVTQMNNVLDLDQWFSNTIVDKLDENYIDPDWLTGSMKGRIIYKTETQQWATTENWEHIIGTIICDVENLYEEEQEEQEEQKLYKETNLNNLTYSEERKNRWLGIKSTINSLHETENYTEPPEPPTTEVPIVDIRDYTEQNKLEYKYISNSTFTVAETQYENALCMTKADPSEIEGVTPEQKWQISPN